MKKIFSILSLFLILFSSLVPWFSHAYTEQEQEAIKLFEELIYSNNETETNTSDNNWLINTLEESSSIKIMNNIDTSYNPTTPLYNPWTAQTEYTYWCYKYKNNDDWTIKITNYTSNCSTEIDPLIVPEKINGKDVTILWSRSFQWGKWIKSIKIPDTLRRIDDEAFVWYGWKFKWNLIFWEESKLEYIGILAFKSWELWETVFPKSLRYIGESAFEYWTISHLTLPSTIEYIGPQAFRWSIWYDEDFIIYTWTDWLRTLTTYVKNEKNITIPQYVDKIEKFAFLYDDLKSVIIPDNVKYIGWGAFAKNSLKSWEVFFYEWWNNDHENLSSYWWGQDFVVIPEGVKTIKKNAFYEAWKYVLLPETIEKIEMDAFSRYWTRLYRKWWDNWIENNERSWKITIIDTETVWCYDIDDNWKILKYLKILPGCDTKNLKIPSEIGWITVTSIWNNAFSEMWLTWITIPDTVKKIEYSAFYNNPIRTLNLWEWVQEIWSNAFYWNKLAFVFLPNSLNKIESYWISTNSKIIYWYRENWIEWLNNQDWQYLRVMEPWEECFNFNKENWHIKWYYIWRNENCTENLKIPGYIDWIAVTMIEPNSYIWGLKSLIIEENNTPIMIWYNAFYWNEDLEEIVINWQITELPYNNQTLFSYYSEMNNIKRITIGNWIERIWQYQFRWLKIKELTLPEWLKYIENYAFFENNLDEIILPKTIEDIREYSFCKDYNKNEKLNAIVQKDIEDVEMYENACLNPIRWYKIKFINNNVTIKEILHINWKAINIPILTWEIWYEFMWWAEDWSKDIIDINNYSVNNDKELIPVWKTIEEKVQEPTTENITYTNETTVTIWDEVQEETINNSSLINLVSKEVEQHEIKEEDNKTKVQESEIQVTSDKTVEYQWWLEVYLEKTTNIGEEKTKERIEWTAKFSSPVAVKIPITSNTGAVKVQVKHEWEDFWYTWLTLNPFNECINWEAVNDKYNWENVWVIEINWEKYALIYTCSASTFVAYTENAKPVVVNESTSTPTPAAWWGRIISTTTNKQSTNEPEHSSADAENKSVEQNTTAQTKEVVIDSKLQQRSLTRWEVAVMTNILLDVYPQLVEWKQEIDDITNACSNYADEQNFTKDEKKAITRLCKLSIMWIHADNNKPLDEFMVNEWTKNNEFSKVINRSISTYTEKDLSVIKEAIKKLEDNEENVEFWTVYNVFMSIKSLFN